MLCLPKLQSRFLSRVLLSAALLAGTACMPAAARPLVDIAVIDRDSGQWLPEYAGRGDTWIAGVPGHRYSVRLSNTSGERVLVVLSVDGVNAVSGQTANPEQTGYVLAPWQSTEINGWRKSLDDVAQFVFTDLPDSYAARTGRPDNVGVIGIAVFSERRRYIPMPMPAPPLADAARGQNASKAAANAPPASESSARDSDGVARQSIGTGHGEREWSPVGRTDFVRASRRPAQVTQLRYDDLDTLAALGIVARPYHGRMEGPVAFPNGFVADPPGW
ncbi:MAG TPA: hypothetical protein VHF02_05840 [Luteimonas sp.]|nr:hypothetical protein [Luteimonas sp.]